MEITVEQLIESLKLYNPDLPVSFGGLDFYRLKDRGGHLQVEFNQSVYLDEDGKVIVENHN